MKMRKNIWVLCILLSVLSIVQTKISTKYIFPNLPISVFQTVDVICKNHSDIYLKNLHNFTLWAHEMWDSTAKYPTGVLRGNVFHLGNFDQCLTANAPFVTKYILVNIKAMFLNTKRPHRDPFALDHDPFEHLIDRIYDFDDPSQQARNDLYMGWCIPASCTNSDSQTFLESYFNESSFLLKTFNITYEINISELSTYTKEDTLINLTTSDIAFCLVLLFLLSVVILSTFYDNMNLNKDEKAKQKLCLRILKSFALKNNLKELFSLQSPLEERNPLSILFGMRTICIFYVIMGHRFGTLISSAAINFDSIEKIYRTISAPLMSVLSVLATDSFFILSGCLATYRLLQQFEIKLISPAYIILMRYIRLTPVYALVIFYYATMLNYTGTGPLWKFIVGRDSKDCRNNWWTNLLYINNYVNTDHICMTHSWFLSADFHYLIIAIGLCMVITKNRKLGLFALSFATIVSMMIPFILIIIFQRPALLYFYPEFLRNPKIHIDFLLIFTKSHSRATPYFIGMITGFIYVTLKDKKFRFAKVQSHCILLLSVFLILVSVFGGMIFYNPYHSYDAYESASFAVLHKVAYAVGSSGILLAASYGHCNLIYNIMSWRIWISLSKLVYGAYLVHMQFQLRSAGLNRTPIYFSPFDTVLMGISDIVASFVVAVGLFLLVEAPIRNVIGELLNEISKRENRNSEPNSNHGI